MARKTNKTAHVLNLLASGTPKSSESEQTADPVQTKQPDKSSSVSNISIIDKPTGAADPLAGLIKESLNKEIAMLDPEALGSNMAEAVQDASVGIDSMTDEALAAQSDTVTTPVDTVIEEGTAAELVKTAATPMAIEPVELPVAPTAVEPVELPVAPTAVEPAAAVAPPVPQQSEMAEAPVIPAEMPAAPTAPVEMPVAPVTPVEMPVAPVTPAEMPAAPTAIEPTAAVAPPPPCQSAPPAAAPPIPQSVTPVAGTSTAGSTYTYINMMELLLEERHLEFMQRFDTCTCERCTIDIKALALTNLPPKYLVMPNASVAPLTSYYRNKYNILIVTELTKACLAIINEPRH